jgi:hypothetical protein
MLLFDNEFLRTPNINEITKTTIKVNFNPKKKRKYYMTYLEIVDDKYPSLKCG